MKTTLMCICGHHFDDHHHGIIMNETALERVDQSFRNINGVLGEECEATQFEGRHFKQPECSCMMYWDKGWSTLEV